MKGRRKNPAPSAIPVGASGRKLYSDDCPQKYTGPIERADGTRPYNGYLWPTEWWWAHREPGQHNWDSRWNFGIVALWDGTFAVMGQVWAIEEKDRRYSWTKKSDQLHRRNCFPTRRQAVRTAAADLLRTLRSARRWQGSERVTRDPVHWAEVVNWVLTTAHREADGAEPIRQVKRDPLPPPPPAPTGMPLIDIILGNA
jgi:hypothetical protein